ncbi:MAG: hypothetical protein LC104_15685 [Bacteroidales bacterium]|nr:hypothetical protein [Bacteroidales bacterium]
MSHKGRKNADDQLVLALACGATAEQAAYRAGVALRTVRRRLTDSAFQKRVADLRREMVERTAAMLTAAASEAVRTLLGLQKDHVQANVRLGAARAILDLGFRARELAELEQELRELEQKVDALTGETPVGQGTPRR